MSIPATVPRPAHIPENLTVDFNVYRPPGAERGVHESWIDLTKGPPVVWTPHNGGHWIGTRADVIVELQTNDTVFSYTSINIPSNPTPSLPLEADPPQHTRLRAVINPLFAVDTLKGAEASAREICRSLIKELKPRGHCEFKSEFAMHLPIVVFLQLVDLPLEWRLPLLELAEKRTRSADAAERNAAKAGMIAFLKDAITKRRKTPGKDFISRILHSKYEGEPLTDFEAENLLATLLSGGLDTVASLMAFSMLRLAEQPELQQRLVDEPGVIPRAVDELTRRHGLANTARVLLQDIDFHGAPLRKGDRIVVPSSLVGLDANVFKEPLKVDFDRANAGQHGTFGNGRHRCPGANLGRLEMRVMLEEWSTSMPRFRLDPTRPVATASGMVSTVQALPLAWDVPS